MEKEPEQEIEEIPQSKIKRVYIFILGLILVILISTYYISFYGVDEVLSGFIQSSKIDKNLSLEFKDKNIVFTKDVYNDLQKLYNENLELEFKVCLKGEIRENDYFIDELIVPEIYSQEYNKVISEPCDKDTLIDLHSHPFRRCLASFQDILNIRKLKSVNEDILLAVMCEEDRFYLY